MEILKYCKPLSILMCTVLLPATAYVDVMLFQQDVTLAVAHNDMGGGGGGGRGEGKWEGVIK